MSNTYKHKGKGYWNRKIKLNSSEVKKFLQHCRRHNREKSYFKEIEIRIVEKDADKDMKQQLQDRYCLINIDL